MTEYEKTTLETSKAELVSIRNLIADAERLIQNNLILLKQYSRVEILLENIINPR